jgi:hypothetical protein
MSSNSLFINNPAKFTKSLLSGYERSTNVLNFAMLSENIDKNRIELQKRHPPLLLCVIVVGWG